MTREELLGIINDTCPRCAEGKPLKWRQPYKEYVHVWRLGDSTSMTICLATHFRQKYAADLGDQVNGQVIDG